MKDHPGLFIIMFSGQQQDGDFMGRDSERDQVDNSQGQEVLLSLEGLDMTRTPDPNAEA